MTSVASPSPDIVCVLDSAPRDLGDIHVRRLLPAVARKMVGPFIFFDEMGPATFEPGVGVDVRPHPHIGLETVTWLFDGEIQHRDSLGSNVVLQPGGLNWMTAGHGIVHSERTPAADRGAPSSLHGLQLWVALPLEDEDTEPSFAHYSGDDLPLVSRPGASIRLLAGSAYGSTSRVRTRSRLIYVDVSLEAGASLELLDGYEERAIYVLSGAVSASGLEASHGRMLVLADEARVTVTASANARFVIFGGDRLEGRRFIDWNFVASSTERIERAKQRWRDRAFPLVPGDELEFIPLPG